MDKEQMKLPPQPWEFRSKPTWQRLLIMIGGVLFNLILALALYAMILFIWGEQYLPNQNAKYGIVVSETGREIGLKNGDKILTVDGKPIESFTKIIPTIVLDGAQSIEIQRDSQRITLPIKKEIIPKLLTDKNIITPRVPFSCKIATFAKQSPARDAGMELGDEILSVDSLKFTYYDEFVEKLAASIGKEVNLEVRRKGVVSYRKVAIGTSGLLGVGYTYALDGIFEYKTIQYSLLESIPAGISKGYHAVGDYLKQFKLLFSPQTKAYESLGGFIAIGNIFPGVWDWESFWNLTAFLSIILAVMNILPIPALDGGHVLFLLYEIVTRHKPSDKFLEYAQIVGMILLFGLLIYANGNDIVKLIFHK